MSSCGNIGDRCTCVTIFLVILSLLAGILHRTSIELGVLYSAKSLFRDSRSMCKTLSPACRDTGTTVLRIVPDKCRTGTMDLNIPQLLYQFANPLSTVQRRASRLPDAAAHEAAAVLATKGTIDLLELGPTPFQNFYVADEALFWRPVLLQSAVHTACEADRVPNESKLVKFLRGSVGRRYELAVRGDNSSLFCFMCYSQTNEAISSG